MKESAEQKQQRMAFAARILSDPEWAQRIMAMVDSEDVAPTGCLLIAVPEIDANQAAWLAMHGIRSLDDLGEYSLIEIVALERDGSGCHVIDWFDKKILAYLKREPEWEKNGPQIEDCAEIGTRAKNILCKHYGLTHLGQLEHLTSGNLLGMYNFGYACLKEVCESMHKHGLRLKDESD